METVWGYSRNWYWGVGLSVQANDSEFERKVKGYVEDVYTSIILLFFSRCRRNVVSVVANVADEYLLTGFARVIAHTNIYNFRNIFH